MKATIEIDIDAEIKYGHTTLSFGPGNTIAADLIKMRRKTPPFRTGNIRRVRRIYASN